MKSLKSRKVEQSGYIQGRVAFALALLLSLALAGVASAHGAPVKSDPAKDATLDASPERVTVWFNQALDPEQSTLQILDAQGQPVDDAGGGIDPGDPERASMVASLPAPLPAGTYTVRWHVVTVTGQHAGHHTNGEFTFRVSDGRALPLGWIAGGLGLLLVGAVGLVLRQR